VGKPETRARILAAARELIPGAGVSLPVTAIARQAGVAIQTIYDQFGSKGGLLVAVVADVQASFGLFARFRDVFRSPDGETAMRRMNDATVAFWAQAWPYLEFLLRSRRVDPVVGQEMTYVDQLRHAHYWAITRRLEQEGRLRDGLTADAAADRAFALSTPTVYEELAIRRTQSTAAASAAINDAVFGALLAEHRIVKGVEPPDWPALEAAAAARAIEGGADPARLSPLWAGTARASERTAS